MLHTRRKRAEHNSSTGRVAGSTAGGDPGVPEEATADAGGGNNIGFIENGDYISFKRVSLKDINRIDFRVASGGAGGKIELRLDSPTGATFASADVAPTGGWQNWTTVSDAADQPAGGHARAVPRVHAPDRRRRAVQPQLVPGPRQGRLDLGAAGRHAPRPRRRPARPR